MSFACELHKAFILYTVRRVIYTGTRFIQPE